MSRAATTIRRVNRLLQTLPIRLTHTPTTFSESHRTIGKGSRWRIGDRSNQFLIVNGVRTGFNSCHALNLEGGSITAQKKATMLTRREAADETTSAKRLTALAEESEVLARIVATNPSAPVSLLRALSRSEDEGTRKGVVTNPRAPYDVLSYLEKQFPEVFVNNPALELYNSLKI